MEPYDDLSAAEELRLLRENQSRARSRAIGAILVLLLVVAIAYARWDAEREADKLGDCLRRNVSIEQC